MHSRFTIEDPAHYDLEEQFDSFERALARLHELALVPWDQAPNRAPCSSWRTCGRSYCIREYDDSTKPRTFIGETPVVEIDAQGVRWHEGFAPPSSL